MKKGVLFFWKVLLEILNLNPRETDFKYNLHVHRLGRKGLIIRKRFTNVVQRIMIISQQNIFNSYLEKNTV